MGGIIFDKMAIQPGLQLQPQGSGLQMFGYVGVCRGKIWNALPTKRIKWIGHNCPPIDIVKVKWVMVPIYMYIE